MGQEVYQVVSADGTFEETFDDFVRSNGLHKSGADYQIVAITGPQSSGKSTLMNKLFGTNFDEMDAFSGRSQTTRGIWLAKSPKIESPATLILDLEGSDGRERGEDDNSFERQSSLFALAISDVLIVNMWAKDVGREAGAGKPLLKTIFQVNLKLFAPDPKKERTVLLFVFRDRTRTPLQRMVETWEEDLRQIWASLAKPAGLEDCQFTDFFEVKYASLPNYEDKEEEFMAETVLLRRRFTEDDEQSLLRPSVGKLPGEVLAMSLKNIWEVIREQKDLNLPAHKVVVATFRCGEIMRERLTTFKEGEEWTRLSHQSSADLLPDFGASATRLLHGSLAGYDEEASLFEPSVRNAKREELAAALLAQLGAAFSAQLALLTRSCLARAKAALARGEAEPSQFHRHATEARKVALEEFAAWLPRLQVEGASWEVEPARQRMIEEVEAHIQRLITSKVAQAVGEAEQQLSRAISTPLIAMLDSCPSDLWARINRLLSSAVPKQSEALLATLQGYQLDAARLKELQQGLETFASARAATHVREAANTALARMRDRFQQAFTRDEEALPRRWGSRDNIPAVMHHAFREAAAVLAQLAILRLGKPMAADFSVVDAGIRALTAAELGPGAPQESEGKEVDFDVQSAADWPDVAPDRVLLAPPQCRQLWRQCVSDSQLVVQQAQATQEANRAASNQMPPLWALAAILLLGFNEFLALLYNPVMLLLCVLLFLFARTVYSDLDIDTEMEAGLLPGLLAVANKFVPTVKKVGQRTVESIVQMAQQSGEERAGSTEVPAEVELSSSTSTAVDHDSLRRRPVAARPAS